MNAQILYSEDFEGAVVYSSVTNGGATCGAGTEPWVVAVETECNTCSGNVANNDYAGGGCTIDETLILDTWTPTQNNVDVAFNYGYRKDGVCTGNYRVYLENEVTNVEIDVISTTATETSGSTFSSNITGLTAGQNYTLRVDFYDVYCAWGFDIDDIVIQHDCAPTATITQNCQSDLTYDVEVQITDLNGNPSANIKSGSTTYFSGVGVGTYTITDLTLASTISVESTDNSACKVSNSFNACDICSLISTPTNDCASAPLIDLSQPFYGSTACSYNVNSSVEPAVCGGHGMNNDSWIKFIAAADSVSLDVTVGTCSGDNDGIQLAVFEGTCSTAGLSLIPGSCSGPGSYPNNSESTFNWSFDGLTVGDEYIIRIDGYAGQLCDYYFEPIAGVAITPPNDECPDTARIECGESFTSSIILATAADAPAACSAGAPGKGVWYVIDGQGNDITLSTDNAGTNFDTQLNVYSGSCGSLTCVGGDDDSGTGTTSEYTFTAASGTTYYIYVDGDGTAEGQFELSVSCIACPADAGTWD